MSRPQINLLAETPIGHTWLEVILDLEPADFRIEHVVELGRALARFVELPQGEVSLICVARWQPMVVLGMPRTSAASIIAGHDSSSGDLLTALGGLSVRSIRLDEEGVSALSISWRDEPEDFEPEPATERLETVYGWGKAFTMATLTVLAMLLGGVLALVAGALSAAGKLWVKAGGSPLETPPWVREAGQQILTWVHHQATLCLADVQKLIAIGLRIPVEGFEPAHEVIWSLELQQAIEKRRPRDWDVLDLWIFFLEIIRTIIVALAASLSFLYQLAHGLALAGFELTERLWLSATSPNGGPIFKDPNDLIFIRMLFLIFFNIFFIWLIWG